MYENDRQMVNFLEKYSQTSIFKTQYHWEKNLLIRVTDKKENWGKNA